MRRTSRILGAAIAVAALATAALLPAAASAAPASKRASKASTKVYKPGTGTRIEGLAVAGFGSAPVFVSVTTNVGTLYMTRTRGLDLAFGYQRWYGTSLSFSGSQAAVNAGLKRLHLFTGAREGTNASIRLLAAESEENLYFLPSTNHFYRYVPQPGVSWNAAVDALEGHRKFGTLGYLATISTATENAFIASKIDDGAGNAAKNVWIGASDRAKEGDWRWVRGPESGTLLWRGCTAGKAAGFARWAKDEPNNWVSGQTCVPNTAADEDCAVINWNAGPGTPAGYWNDLPCGNTINTAGYIVEYGSKTFGGNFTGLATSTSVVRAPIIDVVRRPARTAMPRTAPFYARGRFVVDLAFKAKSAGLYRVTMRTPDGRNQYTLLAGTSYTSMGRTNVQAARSSSSVNVRADANETISLGVVLSLTNSIKPPMSRVVITRFGSPAIAQELRF